MMRMKQIISSLIMYPGQFDDLLMVFMETMYPYFNDVMAMSEIAQLLVGQVKSRFYMVSKWIHLNCFVGNQLSQFSLQRREALLVCGAKMSRISRRIASPMPKRAA